MSSAMPVLKLQVLGLRLAAGNDLAERFPAVCGRIVIHVETLHIEGTVLLPGRDIEIVARVVRSVPAPGQGAAVLDLSGAAAQPDFDIAAAEPALDGTPASPHGRPGQAGGAGGDGGRLQLCADRFEGTLQIVANGSNGGNAQRGGDGAQPPQVNGVDGAFLAAKWPAKGPYGGKVLQKQGLQNYVSWAAGQAGADASPGGDAGASGQPGDGGRGGKVCVMHTTATAPELVIHVAGGAAGEAGLPARPGAAGLPGSGGRNLMYSYNITTTRKAFALSGKDSVIDGYARQYKIAARAPSGRAQAGAGKVPPPTVAQAGASGEASIESATYAAAGARLQADFLRRVLAGAAQARAAGDLALAEQRCRWLLSLTDGRSDEAAAQLHREAVEQLHAPPLPPADPRT